MRARVVSRAAHASDRRADHGAERVGRHVDEPSAALDGARRHVAGDISPGAFRWRLLRRRRFRFGAHPRKRMIVVFIEMVLSHLATPVWPRLDRISYRIPWPDRG